ncbi:MAG: RNA polymerase factor sigma-54 [Erythrobacter sp.]
MALGPRLDLRQSQSLVMTPQLQQAIRLLAASNLEIETFIADALETNPLLEAGGLTREAPVASDGPGEDFSAPAPDEITADQLIAQGHGEAEAPLDLAGAALDRDIDTGDGARSLRDAEWGSASGGGGSEEDYGDFYERQAAEITLQEHLGAQVGALATSPAEEFAARHIIGLLDDAGYLPFALDDIAADLGVDEATAEAALALVQSLDPAGVGARNLAECIAIQAREADRYDPCMAALIANLDLVARGDVARLKRLCQVDDEDFADMLRELRSYDPKPGLAYAPAGVSAVVPDIFVADNGSGGWDIVLNEETLPRLIVNRSYLTQVSGSRASDAAAQGWLREKLADAHWLIRALDQRQKTILKTAAEIVRQQDGFFRRGVAELRPLTLREVAEKIEMHESTVSRVTSSKYLSCARGTFELKYFFTSGVGRTGESSDGEGASSAAIKARIRALIDAEDPKKVLSDQTLAELLQKEGFDLARRTVAKYREAIGIGSSAERRRAKKLASLV